MDRLSTPRIFGYDRSSTFVVDIVPSNVESSMDHYSFTSENNDYLRVTALYRRRIVRGDNWGGICPQRGESASVEGAQKLSNERSSSSFYFGGSRLPPSPFPLPFLFLPLFRAKPRRISSMRGSWKDEVESGRPAYGLINHGMIEERRMNVKWKFVGVSLGINRGWEVNVWGVKILIIIICNNYVIFKKSSDKNKRNE